MVGAPLPPGEPGRLAALRDYQVLDTDDDPHLDRIADLAARATGSPIALVSLVDAERQWFKACIGLDRRETHRDVAFCAWAILTPEEQFVVEDATTDDRFASNPLVIGPPGIRAYAGTPLRTPAGHAIGTLCVIDTVPRPYDEDELAILRDLAELVVDRLEHRIATSRLRDTVLDAIGVPEPTPEALAETLDRTLAALRSTERVPLAWAAVQRDDAPPIVVPEGSPQTEPAGTDGRPWTVLPAAGFEDATAAYLAEAGVASVLALQLRRGRTPVADVWFGLAETSVQPDRLSRLVLAAERVESLYGQAVTDHARAVAEREVLRRAAELQTADIMHGVRRRISATLGHHIRTPLAVLRGVAEQLQHADGEDERAELVDTVRRHVARLDDLLEDLLSVALVSTSLGTAVRRERLDDVVRAQLPLLDGRSVDTDLEEVEAEVDAERVGRAVAAMLDNVLQHAPEATRVRVVLRRHGGAVRLSVADDGPGVADDMKARAFLPFEQGDVSSHAPGVGLGLALVAATAQAHGGRAWADDGIDGGACVHLELPVDGPRSRGSAG